jgi:hypothetical protein
MSASAKLRDAPIHEHWETAPVPWCSCRTDVGKSSGYTRSRRRVPSLSRLIGTAADESAPHSRLLRLAALVERHDSCGSLDGSMQLRRRRTSWIRPGKPWL